LLSRGNEIEGWLAENAPDLPFRLNAGANEKDICSFEKRIGMELPQDFRESLRIHDGGKACDCWIPQHGDLLSLEVILQRWEMYKSLQENGDYAAPNLTPRRINGPIKPIFWNAKRIFVTDNSGNHLTLDLDPPENGTYGQVLDHSREVGPIKVVATSWSKFLSNLACDLESGQYLYFEDDGALASVESLRREVGPLP
jgi:cell wall assembly regulator SMI1